MSEKHKRHDRNAAEPKAPASAPTSADLKRVAEEVSQFYPAASGTSDLVLMDIDPHRAHAYWTIEPQAFAAAQKACEGEATLTLRLYDLTDASLDAPAAVFDIEVTGLSNHWTVDFWQPGRSYIADLGLRRSDRSLLRLARSNLVSTPAAEASASHNAPEVIVLASAPPAPTPEDLLAQQTAPVYESPGAHPPPPPFPQAPTEPPQAPEQGALLPQLVFPAHAPMAQDSTTHGALANLPVEAGADALAFVEAPTLHDVGPSKNAMAPSDGTGIHIQNMDYASTGAALSAESASAENEQAAAPWPALSDVLNRTAVESLEAAERAAELEAQLEASYVTPLAGPLASTNATAALDAATTAGTGQPRMPLPPESYAQLSSADAASPNVWLEINAELLISGRAKPGAELTLYGQRVRVDADGRFAIRRPLPQGAMVLPLLFMGPATER